MANTFKSFGLANVGTVKTTLYTVPASTTATIIGLSVSAVGTSSVEVDVTLTKGATEYHLIKKGPVTPGGALVVVGGDQKVVAETGNIIKVVSSIATSVDVIVSVLEVTA
jgi:hypothetical protein